MYKTIIIEDDPMVSSINKQYLSNNSELEFLDSFRNGKEALNYCETHSVDLAVVDFYMPVMDGLSFIRSCREKKLDLEFIMITAANQAENISTCMQLGAVDYLVKPFTFDRFQTAINRFLDRKKVFSSGNTLGQNEIDRLLALKTPVPTAEKVLLEKGLQQKTLDKVVDYFKSQPDKYLTNDEIAKEIGLSRITVRRYVNYLMDSGRLSSNIYYGTGGRPSIRYKLKN